MISRFIVRTVRDILIKNRTIPGRVGSRDIMITISINGVEESMIRPLHNITPIRQDMVHTTGVNQAEEVGRGLAQASHGTLAPAEVLAVGGPTVNMIGITTSNRTLRMAMTRIGVIQTVTGKGKDF